MRRVLFITIVCFYIPVLLAEDTIKVLTIGNSFSEDAVENYLYDLGQNKGVTFVIGNLYIGGSSLKNHWDNYEDNNPAYSYHKIDAMGIKTSRPNTTLLEGIGDEDWNYISFQQNSGNSGLITTYFPYLSDLLNIVKIHVTNPEVNYIFHQTWAYASDAAHPAFVNYGNDQIKMYNAIVDAVNQATNQVGIDLIIPSGTAIQNGRTSILGDTFNRDGYHLNLAMGRFTAACTWYEKLTALPVQENSYTPANVTESDSEIVKKAAHFSVMFPDTITSLNVELVL